VLNAGLHTTAGVGLHTTFWPDLRLASNQSFNSSGSTNTHVMGLVNLNGRTLTLAGTGDHQFEGTFGGTGTIIKTGAGTATFSGIGQHSGTTRVDVGTLEVNVIHGSVTLNGGTLSGEGFVTNGLVLLAPGGTIAPGHGGTDVGILHFEGSVDMGATNATYDVDLNGSSISQYDSVTVSNNSVDIDQATLSVTLGFTPTAGQSFSIVRRTGAGNVTGTFAQGTNMVVGGQVFGIVYSTTGVLLAAEGPLRPDVTLFTVQPNGAGLAIRGSNGNAFATFAILASTNMLTPLENWEIVATNVCDASGNFAVTNGLVPTLQQHYLMIRSP
jgi:autotransporter-associated beta strand protein